MAFSKFPAVIVYILAVQLFCAVAHGDPSLDLVPDTQSMEKEDAGLEDDGPSVPLTLEELKEDLQTAIEVEEFILPPYLTALVTMKENTINSQVIGYVDSILLNEMLHMGLAGNILNAIDGRPDMTCPTLEHDYPAHLPGGIAPDLQIPIKKMSKELAKEKFMQFELPEGTLEGPNFNRIFRTARTLGNECIQGILQACSEFVTETHASATPTIIEGPDGSHIVYHNNTIGVFYGKVICGMVILECEARLMNKTIFTGDPSKQVTAGSIGLFKVTNLHEAVTAIQTIVAQGEGSEICHPEFDTGAETGVSHYYRYESIVEGHEIEYYKDTDVPSICNGTIFVFNGTEIPFDQEEVWPMVPNPNITMYPEGSIVRQLAEEADGIYTDLLQTLDATFNGDTGQLGPAIGLMHTLEAKLKVLVKTPIPTDGGPFDGLTGGPTYQCTST